MTYNLRCDIHVTYANLILQILSFTISNNTPGKSSFYFRISLWLYLSWIYKINKVNRTTKAQLFHSSNHHIRHLYQILGGKTESTNNRDITERAVRYVVREGVSEGHPS